MSPTPTTEELVTFLKEQALFRSTTEAQIQDFLSYTQETTLEAKVVIADIGQTSDYLYFVIDGEAVIQLEHENKQVGAIKTGEMMGEMGFFDQRPRSTRIVSGKKGMRALKLARDDYMRLRVDHPFVAVNLLEYAVISLDRIYRRINADYASLNQYIQGTYQ